jgi:hypothetical protein
MKQLTKLFISLSILVSAATWAPQAKAQVPQTMVVRVIPNVAVDVAYYYDPCTFLNPTSVVALSYTTVPGFWGPQTFVNYWNGFNWYGYYYRFYQYYYAPIWVFPGYWTTAHYYIYHL